MLDELIADNPFYVLGLRPDCAAREVEREGQRLLAMIAVGLAESLRYDTPVGERARSDQKVRAAMAELRDPSRRLVHELFARLPPAGPPHGPEPTDDDAMAWEGAAFAWGLGPKRKASR